VTLVAGGTSGGNIDGTGSSALFSNPSGLALSQDDSYVYVTEYGNHKVRKIILTSRTVSTIAGSPSGSADSGTTDGVSTVSRLSNPFSVSFDPAMSYALIADTSNNRIRKYVLSTQMVSTFVGSSPGSSDATGTAAQIHSPRGVCISPDGLYALITQYGNHRISKVTISTAVVSAYVGGMSGTTASGSADGVGSAARFNRPIGVSISPDLSFVLIGDQLNSRVRLITQSTFTVTSPYGSGTAGGSDGVGTSSLFNNLHGLAISNDGSFALVADVLSHKIRMIYLRGKRERYTHNLSI
jgi:DNA-binding beta-propeller fold protein YncE